MSQEEKKYYVFFSHIPHSTFIFSDGSVAVFANGRYATDNELKAAALNSEVAAGNTNIYIKPDQVVVTESDLAPDAEYRKRIIAEFLVEEATKAALKEPDRDMGQSAQEPLKPAGSNELGAGAADSSSGATLAPRLSLRK